MEERQVTVAGVSHKMAGLFMVMATQNPIEQAGTYPLPEAQMDRFLMHVVVRYPDEEAEGGIIRLVRGEEISKINKDLQAALGQQNESASKEIKANVAPRDLTEQKTIFEARAEIGNIEVPRKIEDYIVHLIFATRFPQRYSYDLKSFIRLGSSPRGTLALDRAARAHAWLQGQNEVTPDNIKAVIKNVLRHRITLTERVLADRITADDIIEDILEVVKIS
jgi:MoxR-like ATPase